MSLWTHLYGNKLYRCAEGIDGQTLVRAVLNFDEAQGQSYRDGLHMFFKNTLSNTGGFTQALLLKEGFFPH